MPQPPGPGAAALRKGRHSQPNGLYFVTFTTADRIPWFQVFEFAVIMCRCLQDTECLLDAKSLCWVVMPDHVHLLLQLGEADPGRVVSQLKARSALRLNFEIGRKGRFWTPSFHDHALRREENLKGVARYIVANPLRAGLVGRMGDFLECVVGVGVAAFVGAALAAKDVLFWERNAPIAAKAAPTTCPAFQPFNRKGLVL